MHLYWLGVLTLYSLTDISAIRVPINESLLYYKYKVFTAEYHTELYGIVELRDGGSGAVGSGRF